MRIYATLEGTDGTYGRPIKTEDYNRLKDENGFARFRGAKNATWLIHIENIKETLGEKV